MRDSDLRTLRGGASSIALAFSLAILFGGTPKAASALTVSIGFRFRDGRRLGALVRLGEGEQGRRPHGTGHRGRSR